jgi:light-regulated signal transduction histidine kinase (bacteriophytochrome)
MTRKVKAGARRGRPRAAQHHSGAPASRPERDTRELQDLQAQVESLKAELRSANEELEAFSYSVSHDLRAPIRHIDGFIRLLEDELGAPSEKAAHYLATVAGAARRLGGLIDDLLVFSRTARLPLDPRPTDLEALVREIVARFELSVGRPRVQWDIGELPQVSADPAQLRIVLQHLLSNARKFTRPRPQPRVAVTARAGRDGAVEISVRDNGVGFDPHYAQRLFGVFQRLHAEDEFEGNGIGLAVARRILHRHGQRIWADAVPGAGAVFSFTLPLAGSG